MLLLLLCMHAAACLGTPYTKPLDTKGWPASCHGASNGETCVAVCQEGYSGTPTSECLNGKWSSTIMGVCAPSSASSTTMTLSNAAKFVATATNSSSRPCPNAAYGFCDMPLQSEKCSSAELDGLLPQGCNWKVQQAGSGPFMTGPGSIWVSDCGCPAGQQGMTTAVCQ